MFTTVTDCEEYDRKQAIVKMSYSVLIRSSYHTPFVQGNAQLCWTPSRVLGISVLVSHIIANLAKDVPCLVCMTVPHIHTRLIDPLTCSMTKENFNLIYRTVIQRISGHCCSTRALYNNHLPPIFVLAHVGHLTRQSRCPAPSDRRTDHLASSEWDRT